MAAKVWEMVSNDMEMVSNDIENINYIETYKNNITLWEPANWQCKLCLDYVSRLRFR